MDRLVVMTIAGSDSGGGAGIQADLKTFSALGCYGTSVITAITAQNTKKVYSVTGVSPFMVRDQVTAILDDFSVVAIKTGMLYSKSIVEVLVSLIDKLTNLVIDPVMVSTSGMSLLAKDAIEYSINNLFPFARLITPNIDEMQVITGRNLVSDADVELACESLFNRINTSILVKGGHRAGDACDILFDGIKFSYFTKERIHSSDIHGTGCTLSSAIICYLARGNSLIDSIRLAKDYVTSGIISSYPIGQGYKALNHFWVKDI